MIVRTCVNDGLVAWLELGAVRKVGSASRPSQSKKDSARLTSTLVLMAWSGDTLPAKPRQIYACAD